MAAHVLLHSDVPWRCDCAAMRWYQLILEAERFRANTGYGLANVWGCIQRDQYDEARAILDKLLSDENEMTMNAIEIHERPRRRRD
jgi:hypothetical protein